MSPVCRPCVARCRSLSLVLAVPLPPPPPSGRAEGSFFCCCSYRSDGSTYPDCGGQKYFFPAGSFSLVIFHLEFSPKKITFGGQYEIWHKWGYPEAERKCHGDMTLKKSRGAGFGALAMVRYYARTSCVTGAVLRTYFRGHNNEPPLVHRTPRDSRTEPDRKNTLEFGPRMYPTGHSMRCIINGGTLRRTENALAL